MLARRAAFVHRPLVRDPHRSRLLRTRKSVRRGLFAPRPFDPCDDDSTQCETGKARNAGPPCSVESRCRSPDVPRAAISRLAEVGSGALLPGGRSKPEGKPLACIWLPGGGLKPSAFGAAGQAAAFRRVRPWCRAPVVVRAGLATLPRPCALMRNAHARKAPQIRRPGAVTSGHPRRRRRPLPAWPAGPDTPPVTGSGFGNVRDDRNKVKMLYGDPPRPTKPRGPHSPSCPPSGIHDFLPPAAPYAPSRGYPAAPGTTGRPSHLSAPSPTRAARPLTPARRLRNMSA